jgi:hypothetical protein
MKRLLLATVLIATACSPGDAGDTSTSSTPTSSPTTTVGQPATTGPPATTTTVATTTTTTPVSTTTSSLLEGNWADLPLVTTDFGALGWWDDGWLDAENEGALPVVGGEDYQTVVLDTISTTTGGPQTTLCEPLDLLGVELSDTELLGAFPGPYGVAVSAPWGLQPHLFEVLTDDGTYAGFASELLASRGLDVADPVIKQLIRTDLEGDGVNEVLVVAEDVTPGYLLEPGDYSLAFMRKVVEGEVQTAILGNTVVLDEEGTFGGAYTFGGVADLNGDGRMEIILDTAYWEGFSVWVFEYANDDLGPLMVLETGCGS